MVELGAVARRGDLEVEAVDGLRPQPEEVVRLVVGSGDGDSVRSCEVRAVTGPLLQVYDRGVVRTWLGA